MVAQTDAPKLLIHGSMWWGKEAAVEAISGAARGFAAGQFTGGQRVLLAAIPIEQLHPNPQQPRRFIDPESLAEVLRLLAQEPPAVSLSHMALRFPPVSQFLERFRALLRRRSRFDFDAEVREMTRLEQASAFLAVLELRRHRDAADVRLRAFPPNQMARHLADGQLDGFCVGEPFNTLAARQGAGAVVAITTDILPSHPEKVLAVSRRCSFRLKFPCEVSLLTPPY